jgi:hypothetical protein
MREKIRERFAFERNLETHRTESENFSLRSFFSPAYIHFREWNPGTDRKIFRQILLMNLSNNKVRTTHSLNEQIFNQPRQFANGKKSSRRRS